MSKLKHEVETYKKELESWIQTLGLPQHQPSNKEVETILSFTRQMLQEQSSVDLSEDAVILAQYALFLQQKANECQTFVSWSKQVSGRLFGDDRPKLAQWVRAVELRSERISYLARRIELLGQSIGNLVRARYNEGRNQ